MKSQYKILTNLFQIIKNKISNFTKEGENKIKIGFLVPIPGPYATVMASTRLRAYDIINYLNKTDSFYAELYNPGKKYDICIFQKYFNSDAYDKLIKIKKKGTKVILDINVNYFDYFDTDKITKRQTNEIMRFGKKIDGFIAASTFLNKVIKRYFPNKKSVFIPENIDKRFFTVRKVHKSKSIIHLLYVGYATKAKEILIIKDILEKLGLDYNLEMVFICEMDPKIKFRNLKTSFIKFDYNIIFRQLLSGDIKISSRNLNDRYNLAHTFTKIGYPMAVGLPVIASPIDSYLNSPAILCTKNEEWETNLSSLITNPDLRNKLAEQGIKYCKENFSLDFIGKQYVQFFKMLIKEG